MSDKASKFFVCFIGIPFIATCIFILGRDIVVKKKAGLTFVEIIKK